MKGQLLLLPNLLNKEASHELFFPSSVDRAVQTLDGLIAENEKEGRAFLKRFTYPENRTFRDIPIRVFNEHTQEVEELMEPMRQGQKWGLISDAGLPIIADPGYQLVRRATDLGVTVKVFVGPSAIVHALLLSGLSAQRFAFHGYLPKSPGERLKLLESRSAEEKSTQVFMEAPYRNQQMLEQLLQTLAEETLLCVAWDLTLPTQGVELHPIRAWKKRSLPNIHQRPAIFLFQSSAI